MFQKHSLITSGGRSIKNSPSRLESANAAFALRILRLEEHQKYEWRIEYDRQGKHYVATQVWTVQDRKIHVLTFTALSGEIHDLYYPVFMNMVQTFELF